IDSAEENFHVLERINRHAALSHLALTRRMVRVVTHQRRQIERHRKPAAAMLEQVFVALVGLLRRRKAGELPHREKLAAISGGVNATRIWRLAGIAKILFRPPGFGKIGLGGDTAYGNSGTCG